MQAELLERADNEIERLKKDAADLFRHTDTAVIHSEPFESGGKLLRPRIVLLTAGLGQPNWDMARRAALAIELAHVATSYHDDIVDRSAIRRGNPAVHRRLGASVAALGGAHHWCLGMQLAVSLPSELVRRLGQTASLMADGQLRETENAGSLSRSVKWYLRIARKKTAALFELAAAFGGRLGHLPPIHQAALCHWARHFGIAFQIADDLADFATNPISQRPPCNDLRERIYTLPVILGAQVSGPAGDLVRELLHDDGRPLGRRDVEAVTNALRTVNAFDEASRIGSDQLRLSADRLAAIPPGDGREALLQMLSATEARLDRYVVRT